MRVKITYRDTSPTNIEYVCNNIPRLKFTINVGVERYSAYHFALTLVLVSISIVGGFLISSLFGGKVFLVTS